MDDFTNSMRLAEESSLMGLPRFLSFLNSFPEPSKAMESLLFGPLVRFHARATALWILDGDLLKLVTAPGHDHEEMRRWSSIDLGVDAPAAKCAREGLIQVYSREALLAGGAAVLSTTVENQSVDAFFFGFDRSVDNGGGDVVVAPISVNGDVIGVYGFMLNEHFEWSAADLALLSAVGFGLALWMVNTNTPEVRRFVISTPNEYISMALSTRQKDILRLVEKGDSNAQIANALEVSISTVKQELHRIALSLDVVQRQDAAQRARDIGLLN